MFHVRNINLSRILDVLSRSPIKFKYNFSIARNIDILLDFHTCKSFYMALFYNKRAFVVPQNYVKIIVFNVMILFAPYAIHIISANNLY